MLYTRESGTPGAPAVVFLHGGGLSSKMWQPQFERLPEFHCLAPDMPEHGESRDVKPFTLEDTANRIAEIIHTRAPGGRAHVVGLSLGGPVILEMLRRMPETIDRAMVTGSAAVIGRMLGAFTLSTLWTLRFFKPEMLVKTMAQQQGIPERYLSLFKDDLLRTGTSEEFNREMVQCLMTMRLPERLERPLLVAVGGKETLAAKAAARKLARTFPSARGVLVPGLNHVWNLQDPDLFTATVRAWVTGAPLPAALRAL